MQNDFPEQTGPSGVLREIALWLPVAVIPIFNGIVRMTTYEAVLGSGLSGLVSTCLDIALIAAYALLVHRRGAVGRGGFSPLARGALWGALSTANHFLLGHFGFGIGWADLVAKYNVLAGETWLYITVAIFAAPVVAAALRR